MKVNLVCHWDPDKVRGRKRGAIHRMARYLQKQNDWTMSQKLDASADVNYVFGYADTWKTEQDPWQKYQDWPGVLAGYFTHQEPTGIKRRLWEQAATTVDVRISESRKYARELARYGPTEQAAIPVERERFCLADRVKHSRPIVGVSGYCPISGRKGNAMICDLARYPAARGWEIKAAGRGWPVPTKMYRWRDLPGFYQQLDVYLCPSLVEGGPLGVFEALSCGTPVVIPRDVGALDELPNVPGVYRYSAGDFDGMYRALEQCIDKLGTHNRQSLRGLTAGMTVADMCLDHVVAFDKHFAKEGSNNVQ